MGQIISTQESYFPLAMDITVELIRMKQLPIYQSQLPIDLMAAKTSEPIDKWKARKHEKSQ